MVDAFLEDTLLIFPSYGHSTLDIYSLDVQNLQALLCGKRLCFESTLGCQGLGGMWLEGEPSAGHFTEHGTMTLFPMLSCIVQWLLQCILGPSTEVDMTCI